MTENDNSNKKNGKRDDEGIVEKIQEFCIMHGNRGFLMKDFDEYYNLPSDQNRIVTTCELGARRKLFYLLYTKDLVYYLDDRWAKMRNLPIAPEDARPHSGCRQMPVDKSVFEYMRRRVISETWNSLFSDDEEFLETVTNSDTDSIYSQEVEQINLEQEDTFDSILPSSCQDYGCETVIETFDMATQVESQKSTLSTQVDDENPKHDTHVFRRNKNNQNRILPYENKKSVTTTVTTKTVVVEYK